MCWSTNIVNAGVTSIGCRWVHRIPTIVETVVLLIENKRVEIRFFYIACRAVFVTTLIALAIKRGGSLHWSVR